MCSAGAHVINLAVNAAGGSGGILFITKTYINMNPNAIYILNPCYYLHDDVRRCQIGAYSEPKYDIKHSDGCLLNIHPLVGQMLSVFDGERTMSECVDLLSEYFELSKSEIAEILTKYTENTTWLGSEDDTQINLLENILIEKGSYERPEYYQISDFTTPDTLDLTYGRNYKPVFAIFELTMRCYTDCTYCYADRSRGDKDKLTLDEIKDIIRQMKAFDVKEISINGGEVLMHPDIKEILIELTANGYYPVISTKYPVGREMLEFLKSINILDVQVSLDSVNPETLSKILNVGKDYFSRISETLKMLDEMEFNWRTNTIITKYNSDVETEVKPLMTYLASHKNIKKIGISEAGYSLYKSNEHYQEIKPTFASMQKIAIYMSDFKQQHPNLSYRIQESLSMSEFSRADKADIFANRSRCTGNTRAFIILPDGKVTICEELYWHPKFLIGDLRKNTLQDVWTGDKAVNLYNISQMDISNESACKQCKTFDDCRQIRGVCWKVILESYGTDKWDYPDPKCPASPMPKYAIYLD